jgi:hypothetical protein
MSKVSDIGGRKKAEPVCRHCAKVPASEHPFHSCPRIERVHECSDGDVIYEYAQVHAVEVTHRVTSDPVPPDAEKEPDA